MSSAPTPGGTTFWRSKAAVASLLGLVVVLLFELIMSRGSGDPGQAVLFLGRFHPLIVHLPIGIWVLVALGEVASLSSRLRPRIDPALDLALPVLVLSTVTAFALGHFLGKAGGFPPNALTMHRRLELLATLATLGCLLLWALSARRGTSGARWAYRALLGVSVGLLSIGAHFGGTLTRGDTYLSKYAPGFLKPLLGGEETKPPPKPPPKPRDEPLLYADVVQPLLDKYCVSCHGADKSKGKLRLDSLAGLEKGGDTGPALRRGDATASLMVQRMRLPESDDDRMPPAGEHAPSEAEIALVGFWIDRGAGDALRVRDLLIPEGTREILQNSIAPGSPAGAPGNAPAAAPAGDAEPTTGEPDDADTAAVASTSEPAATSAESDQALAEAIEPQSAPASEPVGSSALEILAQRCGGCHGTKRQKAKLRVDSVAALHKGGKSGPALVPGSPDDSSIIQRVRLPLADDRHMPPDGKPQLAQGELATLVAWVRAQEPGHAPAAPAVAAAPAGDTSETALTAAATDTTSQTAAGDGSTGASMADEPAADTAQQAAPDKALLARLPARVTLYRDAVHPLLMDRCGKCHSGATPKADLDVSSVAALKSGGWSGAAVVPSAPDDSLVVQRSELPQGDDDRMPPPGEPPIVQGEVDLLRSWVALGAAEDTQAETRSLSAAAVAVLADMLDNPRKDRSADGEAAAELRAKSGGCAACAVGSKGGGGGEGWALALCASLLLLARRTV